MKRKKIFANFLLGICAFASFFSSIHGNTFEEDNAIISLIFTKYKQFLRKRGWITQNEQMIFKAFRFASDYDEIVVQIYPKRKSSLTTFEIIFSKNGKVTTKTLVFQNSHPNYAENAEKTIIAQIVSLTFQKDANLKKNPHFTCFSTGYSRTHDTFDIFPENNKGGYYISLAYAYDPSRLTDLSQLHLNFAEYLTIRAWLVIDNDPVNRNYINENFFNFDIIFWGTHYQKTDFKHKYRIVQGLFTGMEYFRPGWKDNILLWSHNLYRDQPHIQYMIWRAIAWGFLSTIETNYGIWSLNFMVGFGPSINSSLHAVGWDQEEEINRSPLFQSLTGSKQNYYYSTAYPLSFSISLERLWRITIGINYNFYFFYASDPAIKGERAYDIVHLIKSSIGMYITEKLQFQASLEKWYIHSMLNGKHTAHGWNRFFVEILYCI